MVKQKSISKMTVKELKDYIRNKTSDVNEAIKGYKESGKKNPILDREIAKLHKKGAKGKQGQLGLGFYKLRKSGLQSYARALNRTEKLTEWLQYKPEAVKKRKEKLQKQYETFQKNNKEFEDISFNEYLDFADAMGGISSITELDSEQQKYIYEVSKDNGVTSKELLDTFRNTYESSKGSSMEEFIDALLTNLRK